MNFFGKIIRKLETLEKLETMMKKDCFFEKKKFIFLKAFFTKIGRRKICRRWPAVLVYISFMWALHLFENFICFYNSYLRSDLVLFLAPTVP